MFMTSAPEQALSTSSSQLEFFKTLNFIKKCKQRSLRHAVGPDVGIKRSQKFSKRFPKSKQIFCK